MSVTKFCQQFLGGEPTSKPVAIFHGMSHKVWKVCIADKTYAVKSLSRLTPEIDTQITLGEQAAIELLAAGFPTLVAERFNDRYIAQVDDNAYMAFEWIEGDVLPLTTATPQQTAAIATLLATLHNTQFKCTLSPSFSPVFTENHWAELLTAASKARFNWGNVSVDELMRWSQHYAEALPKIQHHLAPCHMDITQTNVIWRGGDNPVVIDWEYICLFNPTAELMGCAVDWAGLSAHVVDEAIFQTFIQMYCDAGGVIETDLTAATWGIVGQWLVWLEYNMQRSVNTDHFIEDAATRIEQEIVDTMESMRMLEVNIERYCGLLS